MQLTHTVTTDPYGLTCHQIVHFTYAATTDPCGQIKSLENATYPCSHNTPRWPHRVTWKCNELTHRTTLTHVATPNHQNATYPWSQNWPIWPHQSRQRMLVIWLVCALSPVNPDELYQSWKQSSIYPLVSHSTSHYMTSVFFSNYNSNDIHNFRPKTHKNNNMFWNLFIFRGTEHGNLHQLPVTISRVTHFILQAHTGSDVSHK